MSPTEKEKIFNDWFVEGVHRCARYLIIVSSKYDYLEPAYVYPEQNIQNEVLRFAADPYYKIEGVIDLLNSKKDQVNALAVPNHILISTMLT